MKPKKLIGNARPLPGVTALPSVSWDVVSLKSSEAEDKK